MISVIVPVYNAQSSVDFCINSILAQSYKSFELILVNDGSVDASGIICDKWAREDERVRVFHKNNGGASSARNIGIDNARGDFICFVDSDDVIPDDYLIKLRLNDEEDLSVCSIRYNNDLNGYKLDLKEIECKVSDLQGDLVYLLLHMAVCSPCCKMFRKRLIDKYNLRFNEDVKSGEDMLFVYDYFASGLNKLKTINTTFYQYNINPLSLSHRLVHFNESAYICEAIKQKINIIEAKYSYDCTDVKNELLCTQLHNMLRWIKSEQSLCCRIQYYRKLLTLPAIKELLLEQEYIISRKGRNSIIKSLLIRMLLSTYALLFS